MASTERDQKAEAEAHGQHIKEKSSRENRPPLPLAWPMDENGEPMAIVTAQASDLFPTVPFGNVNLFASIMRPVKNGSYDDIIMEQRLALLMSEYVVATERRLIQWAMDPSTKIEKPAQMVSDDGLTFEQFVADRLGIQIAGS